MRVTVVAFFGASLSIQVAFAPIARAQVQLDFVPPSAAVYTRVLQLPSGDRLLVGARLVSAQEGTSLYPATSQRWQVALSDFNSTFQPYYALLGGSGNDIPQDAAVDPAGNVWIVGKTDSDDFYLVNPIVGQKVAYRTAGFVLELDPTGTKLLFATYLAGQLPADPGAASPYATYATAIAFDRTGSAYVGGTTDEADFPTTPGAYPSGKGGVDNLFNATSFSFLVKISPAGKLVYSTELVTGANDCPINECVEDAYTTAGVSNLAVDSSGAATLAGVESGSWNPGLDYVVKVAADGSKLLWTASLAPASQAVLNLSMAQDSSGNVDLLEEYAPLIYRPFEQPPEIGTPGLFAAKLKADGSGPIYSTDLGQSADARTTGVVLDSAGNAYLAGTSSSTQFPTLSGVPNLGADFVLRLDPAGATPQTLFRFPTGVVTAPPAFDQDGRLLLLEAQGAVLTLPPSYAFDTPAIVGFANSASNALNTGLFPGTLITLYGYDLAISLAGVQVTVNGVQAPLLFAGPNQVNLQVPFELQGGSPAVEVTVPGGSVSLSPPSSKSIGIFTVDGTHAAALNQDGTVNSASNPALLGSIVTLFGTGASWLSAMQDGAVATAAIPTQDAFELDPNYSGSKVLYAGSAPGLIDGVFQLNLQLPPGSPVPLTLQVFDPILTTNMVSVYLTYPPGQPATYASTSRGLGIPRRAN
jgi:uncharacterized protein (TIGR03437 family)